MTTILGILNITEDSFSDGAKYLEPSAAIAHGRELIADGAQILDIGAASSNPDSKGVPPDIEIANPTARSGEHSHPSRGGEVGIRVDAGQRSRSGAVTQACLRT